MPVQIPIPPGELTPRFSLQAELSAVTYTLLFIWNARALSWRLDILDQSETTIAEAGIALVEEYPIGLRALPAGYLWVFRPSPAVGDLTDLQTLQLLYFVNGEPAS